MLARLFGWAKEPERPSVQPPLLGDPKHLSLAIEQVGVWPFKTHMVTVDPGNIPEEANAALQIIMNMNDENARRAYGNYSFFTNINNFLGTNNPQAIEVRKNRVLPYLVPKYYFEAAQQSLGDLLKKFAAAEDIVEVCGRFNVIHDPNDTIILNHCIEVFLRVFLDAEMDDPTKKLLHEIEADITNPYLLLAPEALRGVVRYLPNIADKIAKYDAAISQFVHAKLVKLKNETPDESAKRNWWRDAIAAKFPDMKITDLSEADIQLLTKDPDVRLCVQVILGVSNIAKLLTDMIRSLFKEEYVFGHRFLSDIQDEINHIGHPITQADLCNKDLMPNLHAAYLEALRLNSPLIARYTSNELKLTEKLTIPASSYIVYTLNLGRELFGGEYLYTEYAPARFIDKETKKLNNDAKHALEMFHPFGVGPRQCPGQHVTEVFCKSYIVGMVQNVLKWQHRRIIVKPQEISHSPSILR